jgi:hypothetical protein
MDMLDYIELYHSGEEFSPEREREISEKYEEYIMYLNEQAEAAAYENCMEI